MTLPTIRVQQILFTTGFLGDNVLLAGGGDEGTFLTVLAAWAGGGWWGGSAVGMAGCCRRTVLGVEFSLGAPLVREMEPALPRRGWGWGSSSSSSFGWFVPIVVLEELRLWNRIVFLIGHSTPVSLYFRLFNTVDSKQIRVRYKSLPWLDSNRGPLATEATALPTEPQPLPTG